MDALLKPGWTPLENDSAVSPDLQVRVLNRLAAGLEERAPGSAGHARRVAVYSAALAERVGLPSSQVERVRRAGALHDIGKVGTPVELVNKPGPLSAEEFAIVQRHSVSGARMVAGLGDEELAAIVRSHHERFDGRGYPDGLAGEEIPIGARIVAVADTFDAVASTRPYRLAMRASEALQLLDDEAGEQLDPDLIDPFRDFYSEHRRQRRVVFRG
jgi:putative nucleotidyltransferase with HDIG domain